MYEEVMKISETNSKFMDMKKLNIIDIIDIIDMFDGDSTHFTKLLNIIYDHVKDYMTNSI